MDLLLEADPSKDMEQLVESIKENGVIEIPIVLPFT